MPQRFFTILFRRASDEKARGRKRFTPTLLHCYDGLNSKEMF